MEDGIWAANQNLVRGRNVGVGIVSQVRIELGVMEEG